MRFAVNPAGALRLLRDIEAAPRATTEAVTRAMVESVTIAEAEVRRRTPERTGRLRRSVQGRVDARGEVVKGAVTIGMPSYARFVEEGTRPHIIRPRHKKALAFEAGGRTVIVRRVRHPGTRGAHMLRDGMAAAAPQIEAAFLRAADRIAEAVEVSTASIEAGVAAVLRGVPGVGMVAEARTGLPAWLMKDHPNSAYALVTREPNAAGEETAVGVGPIVFHFTNVRIELWLRQTLEDSQPVWDSLVDEVAAALRTNKTLGGQANLDCFEPQPVVDDEQQLTDGAAEAWLHHAIWILRVREVIRYTPYESPTMTDDPEEEAPPGAGSEDAAEVEPGAAPAWKPEKELRPENDPDGPAEVGFSRAKRQCYHLQRAGSGKLERVYHDVPDGYEFDAAGRLQAKGD